MDVEAIVVPLGFFLMLFGITATVMYFRFRQRQEVQQTIRALVDSGQPLSAQLLEELRLSSSSGQSDLRRGAIGLALGLSMVLFSLILGEKDAQGPLYGLAAFPFVVGAAYLLLWRLHGANANRATNRSGHAG